jgi:hypothetical protein
MEHVTQQLFSYIDGFWGVFRLSFVLLLLIKQWFSVFDVELNLSFITFTRFLIISDSLLPKKDRKRPNVPFVSLLQFRFFFVFLFYL